MLINEVSKITGFSKDTIRYYEKIGLIELNRNNRGFSNYRHFGNREIEKLRQIKLLKEFGFTLKDIKFFFKLRESGLVKCDSVSRLVDEKISVIDEKINQLNVMRSRLVAAQQSCTGDCAKVII